MTDAEVSTSFREGDLSNKLGARGRALLLLINCTPLVLAMLLTALAAAALRTAPAIISVILVLYVLPPVAARLILLVFPIRCSRISAGSPEFYSWWAVFNMQTIFLRFPILEELLRLVPGLYSLWLRLWGARIGRLTYWAPGTTILDRPFLRIGNDVVFGAGVRINPHVLLRDEHGQWELLLSPVTIGDKALIGGYALLTAGSEVAAGASTKACCILPPFSRLNAGKERRIKSSAAAPEMP